MKKSKRELKSKNLISRILSFFSKSNPAPKGNNFDLWEKNDASKNED